MSLSRECSGMKFRKNVNNTAQLQFHVVKFDRNGNVLSSKHARFASAGQDKRVGKGKENAITATPCNQSYTTQQQVSQTYRVIALRPAASNTSIQQSTLSWQQSANSYKNIPEKLIKSKTSGSIRCKIVRVLNNFIQQADDHYQLD